MPEKPEKLRLIKNELVVVAIKGSLPNLDELRNITPSTKIIQAVTKYSTANFNFKNCILNLCTV